MAVKVVFYLQCNYLPFSPNFKEVCNTEQSGMNSELSGWRKAVIGWQSRRVQLPVRSDSVLPADGSRVGWHWRGCKLPHKGPPGSRELISPFPSLSPWKYMEPLNAPLLNHTEGRCESSYLYVHEMWPQKDGRPRMHQGFKKCHNCLRDEWGLYEIKDIRVIGKSFTVLIIILQGPIRSELLDLKSEPFSSKQIQSHTRFVVTRVH